ncbi:MAG: 6-phosphogluconolactonase [Fimbriimonadaceae bacterium]|nr:6-phosphogluconolactonase [Fimbriimonadaceae bacterium]
MTLEVLPDPTAVGRRAAQLLQQFVARRPAARVAVAAGSSPRPLYATLAGTAAAVPGDWAEVRWIKLDEWLGVPASDPASCEDDLRRHLLTPLQVPATRWLTFDSMAPDPAAEVARVRRALDAAGPLDAAVLGLGLNGHLGMNDPAPELTPRFHVAELAAESRTHSMLLDLPAPPTHGLTLGLADLLEAELLLLPVTGRSKRAALQRLLQGPLSTAFPASLLQGHRGCRVLADHAAAGQ